jgi:hypothetical protein
MWKFVHEELINSNMEFIISLHFPQVKSVLHVWCYKFSIGCTNNYSPLLHSLWIKYHVVLLIVLNLPALNISNMLVCQTLMSRFLQIDFILMIRFLNIDYISKYNNRYSYYIAVCWKVYDTANRFLDFCWWQNIFKHYVYLKKSFACFSWTGCRPDASS